MNERAMARSIEAWRAVGSPLAAEVSWLSSEEVDSSGAAGLLPESFVRKFLNTERLGAAVSAVHSPRNLGSDRVGMLVGSQMERFFDGGFDDLCSILRVAHDGVVIHREPFAAHFGLEYF